MLGGQWARQLAWLYCPTSVFHVRDRGVDPFPVPLRSLILYASQKHGYVMKLHCWSVLYKGTIVYNKTDIVVVEE